MFTNEKMAAASTFVGLRRTVCWDISGAYPEQGQVPVPEWMEFLRQDVGMDLMDISDACQHSTSSLLLITCYTEEVFKATLAKAESGVMWSKFGKQVCGWSAGEETSTVTLQNIIQPENLESSLEKMKVIGKVLSQKVHYYKEAPHIRNGMVTLTMKLKPDVDVPRFINCKKTGNVIQVYSTKQEKKCWRCMGKGHVAATCKQPFKPRPKNKPTRIEPEMERQEAGPLTTTQTRKDEDKTENVPEQPRSRSRNRTLTPPHPTNVRSLSALTMDGEGKRRLSDEHEKKMKVLKDLDMKKQRMKNKLSNM